MADKASYPQSEVSRIITSKSGIFLDFQDRMLHWMNRNYSRILDLFRRFDSDNSGTISYEEFAAGMRDLGAPATQVEIYLMAMTLDSDGDKQLDYMEFKKLRRQRALAVRGPQLMKTAADLEDDDDDEPSAQLQPCPRCNVGLWEPVVEDVSGYIMLHLRSMPFQEVTTMPGHISTQVPSNITVYGISLIVKRELGPCTLNIRIYQPKEKELREEMAPRKKLCECGFFGSLPPDEPEPLTLMYDYDYPLLDCPLLMANFSI